MTLAMTRPWKHPKTGIYWLRKRVPSDLIAIIGRREIQRSLNTRDPAEAKRQLALALVDLGTQWSNLRAGPTTLSERQAHELALFAYDRWLAAFRENPSQQTVWRTDLFDRMWAPASLLTGTDSRSLLAFEVDKDILRLREQELWCERGADDVLSERGLVPDAVSRMRVAKALAAATQRASLVLAKMAVGELDADEPAST
ncbi:MAG TPA: DUF6538 domain-containing protein, partial [Salinarimonas sp.]|nr:DUF6538 domain-containing protein [Salinarimonas sp.]